MSLSIKDQISPRLQRGLKKMKNKRPVLEAAGAAVEGISVRAFRDESLRASEWEPLTEATLAAKGSSGNLLIESGALVHSLRHVVGSNQVEIGSDRPYAAAHQFGYEAIPARPFMPIVGDRLTAEAAAEVRSAVEAVIERSFR